MLFNNIDVSGNPVQILYIHVSCVVYNKACIIIFVIFRKENVWYVELDN